MTDEQRRFLPAALEIQETPPSPAGRWLVWTLLSLFTVSVLWACFGHVDIVVSAPGRVVPSGQVKIVQTFETGTVLAIHVQDGDRVQAGQPLISLDPTYANADNQRIGQQIAELSLELNWRRALEAWHAGKGGSEDPLESSKYFLQDNQDTAKALYEHHLAEITARLKSIEKDREATRAELTMARAESARIEATLPILTDRVAAYKALYDQQFGAKVAYLEMLQQRTDMERSLPVLQAREQKLIEELGAFEARLLATREENRMQNLLQLTRLESEKAALTQDGKKASQRQQQHVLTAPVTGSVQQLAIHTVGGVVTPAQELMKIVPEAAIMEVEVTLQNKDIGFVREGQVAEVKIDTFNFTRYGIIDAEIQDISDDAVANEQFGWVFPIRLMLNQDSIEVEGRLVRLSPGMSVTAEIQTGQRRLIEFFLSPLLRYKQESIRER